ncbi:MAG: DUF5694 domain-containing protein [Cyclobacteriaceae bacterium]|nr:DUF5694 domain-containing protein [Cyclobacteriaceae bacterium]
MQKIFLITIISITASICFGQANPKKIKILIVGTFHFHHSLDSNSRLHSQLFTQTRQKQVAEIVNDLVAFAPDRIFIERKTSDQTYTDSVYMEYIKGNEPKDKKSLANEIVQLGFNTSRKLNLPAPICVDFRPEAYSDNDYKINYPIEKNLVDIWQLFDNNEDNIRTNAEFFDKRHPIKRTNLDSILQKSTLKDFLLYMNRPKSYVRDTYNNWNWFYSKGGEHDYTGMDWLANFWYGRNLKIYGNILRRVDYQNDKNYILIIGATHISFLKYLFSENPYFEVVELEEVLKK